MHVLLNVLMLALSLSAGRGDKVRLHTVDMMNTKAEPLDSHAGEEAWSVLEPVYGYMNVVPSEKLVADGQAMYPRIKKMSDGRYMLFCQGGQIASGTYCYVSDDLMEWSGGRMLFRPYEVDLPYGTDTRKFTTVDAAVLPDGDILAVCSFRAEHGYRTGEGCGLAMRRSRDNGESWSDEKVIYEGPNWEPYLLVLPDGTLHCYFTDCDPQYRNSGTSLLVSYDNGETWEGYRRVCRQYKYTDRGVNIYTDQMPSFRVLNDGRTILGFLEGRLEPFWPDEPKKSVYKMSVVRNDGLMWQNLGENSEGPDDRDTDVFEGCAGYVSVFPSGETLLSCNIDRLFSLRIGDTKGKRFNGPSWEEGWLQPFPGKGFWGSTELMDAHRAIGTMHCSEGIQTGVFYLNHRIDAVFATPEIDGDGSEWESDQALFIGSDSPAQAIFRASHDEEYMYVLVERTYGDTRDAAVELQFCCDSASGRGPVLSLSLDRGRMNKMLSCGDAYSLLKKVKCKGREAETESGDEGYVYEIAVPLSLLGVSPAGKVRMNAVVCDGNIRDAFTFADAGNPSSWMLVRLSPPVGMSVETEPYGCLSTGEDVTLYRVRNSSGAYMEVIDYGCRVVSINVPDRNGILGDVIVGYGDIGNFENGRERFFGAVVGRYGNRIGGARFSIDGDVFEITGNELIAGQPVHLHGGDKGFDRVMWNGAAVSSDGCAGVRFSRLSSDGEEGYPGNLACTVTYWWTEDNVCRIEYEAETDRATVVNMSNHSYFNLRGGGSVMDHVLQVNSDFYIQNNAQYVPELILPVVDSPFDMRKPARIDYAMDRPNAQIDMMKGFSVCWMIKDYDGTLSGAADLYEPVSGRGVNVWTTEPGLLTYTGRGFDGKNTVGKYGPVEKFGGMLLETIHFADSPNQPRFPSVILRPGEKYRSVTEFRFYAK